MIGVIAGQVGKVSSDLAQVGFKGSRISGTGAGTFTPTVTGWYVVRTQAGGAGSGGVKATAGTPTLRSGGGGAGEYVEMRHFLTATTGYSYSVGAGGTAGSASPASGGVGGNTSFTGPVITQTALGGAGSPPVNSGSNVDGIGGTGGRKDGNTTSGAAAVLQGPECWGGANGGQANTTDGGYAGGFSSPASASKGGSGGSSLFGSGGTGASSAGNSGSAGVRGSGGGGSWTASTTGVAGAAGGDGFIEFEYVGIA